MPVPEFELYFVRGVMGWAVYVLTSALAIPLLSFFSSPVVPVVDCVPQNEGGGGVVDNVNTVLGRGCLCPPGEVPKPGRYSAGSLRLSRSLDSANGFLRDRTIGKRAVLLVMANRGNSGLVDNLLCSLTAVGIKHYVLFASDPESYRYYHIRGYSGAFYDSTVFKHALPPEALEIQDGPEKASAWADLLRARLGAVAYVLNKGFNVLFTDADVVFNRDVTRELEGLSRKVDAVFMWDGPTSGKQYPAW
eukprot:CAMPEP_0177762980 /NCGR_PEP_ID=MMETSP0491_2-20121128/6629_1 /TAXON_ID=63592 /ORGANISM="Tetraselmis chuii, Strain PLY429" /LENGTH=247 /DNA_ID=CAMNT_0019279061 /DNA_START=183 /DNA_END=924 /DNA_ORIENTATION=-